MATYPILANIYPNLTKFCPNFTQIYIIFAQGNCGGVVQPAYRHPDGHVDLDGVPLEVTVRRPLPTEHLWDSGLPLCRNDCPWLCILSHAPVRFFFPSLPLSFPPVAVDTHLLVQDYATLAYAQGQFTPATLKLTKFIKNQ